METPQRAPLIALGAAYFVFGTGSLAVVGLIEPMSVQWKSSHSAVAQLVSVFAVAFALLAPLVQLIAARLPQRSVVVGGLLTVAAGLIGTALSPNLAVAIGFRILTALGAAAVGPVASALATRLAPEHQQARALATVFGGMTVATVVGVPLSTWLGHWLSWQAVFASLGMAALLAAAAVAHFVRDRSSGTAVRLVDLANLVRRPASRWAVGTTLMQMAAQFATYALIAVLLRERFGAGVANVSAVLVLFGVGGLVANALVARLGDRFSVESVLRSSLLGLAAVFLALAVIRGSLHLAMVVIALWSLAATAFMVPQQQRLVALAPAQRGLLLAANASALYLGMSLGTVVGSVAHDQFGIRALPVASLLLVLLATGSHLLSLRAVREEGSAAMQPKVLVA